MKKRVLSLIIFRGGILLVALIYQISAVLVGLQAFPLQDFLNIAAIVFALNLVFFSFLEKGAQWVSLINQVKIQFLIDTILVSFLVILTGGFESPFRVGYILIILMTTLFLSQNGIYIFTLLCFSFFYLSAQFVQDGFFLGFGERPFDTELYHYALAGQFLFFFAIGFVSTYFQRLYQSSSQQILAQEHHIREQEILQKRIFEALHSGIATCDERLDVRYMNHRGAQIFAGKPEQFIGQKISDLFQIEELEFRNAMTTSGPIRFETKLWGKTIVGGTLSFMASENNEGFLVVFQDLTDIKAKEQLRQLHEKMAAIGRVAAGAAHEIRNPLAAISGSIQVLKDVIPKEETAMELIDIVEKESTRLDHILTEFLAYSKSTPDFHLNRTNIVQLFRDFLKISRNASDLNLINIVFLAKEEPLWVDIDAARISQVFWNLIRNAAQASQPGQEIVVQFKRLASSVFLEFSDEGHGIPEEYISEIFTPFVSLNKKQGTGIGLAIVYEIIQRHHGSIAVTSNPESGTKFVIELPESVDK